jgi:ketosteroid isomerase-like protein
VDPETAKRLVDSYVGGWRDGDRERILRTLDEDCVVVESYGPVHRGKARVGQWIEAWFGEGNTVDAWEVTSLFVAGSRAAFEWRFGCTYHGERAAFEGASVVEFSDGRIVRLREYCTTEELYEWEGEWRS